MPNRPTPDGLLTPSEAAAILGVSPRTLSRWADENRIPVVILPSGHRRFRPQDINALRQPKASA